MRRYLPKVSEAELCALRRSLCEDSLFDLDYVVLCIAACAIASLGLLVNSSAVIIGAMIVAPLMTPMRGLALGALEGDVNLFRSSAISIFVGLLLSVGMSAMLGRLSQIPATEFGSEILARTQPTLVDLAIALAAGTIAGFAKIRPHISDALAGTAISVALMPPLCVVGLSVSQGNYPYARGAMLLYTTNLLGITLACMTVFALAGYYLPNSGVTRAFSSTLVLIGAIVVPLSFSRRDLLSQVRLQAALRETLIQRTITIGRQAELLGTDIDWGTSPPRVYLSIRSNPNEPVTPTQVFAVEELVSRVMGRRFELIFQVQEFAELTSDDYLSGPIPGELLPPSRQTEPPETFAPPPLLAPPPGFDPELPSRPPAPPNAATAADDAGSPDSLDLSGSPGSP